VVQFVFLFVVVVVVVPLSLAQVGGVGGLVSSLPAGHLSPVDPSRPFSNEFKSWIHIFGWMVMLATAANTEKAAQRYFSVPDERQASKSALLAGLCFFFSPVLFFIPPLVARVTHPNLASVDTAYAVVCLDVLPVGMVGLLLAAMASATMSMTDSIVNMVAAILSRDVFQPLLRKSDDKHLLWLGQIITLVLGLGSIGVAILVNHGFETVFTALTKLWGWGGLPYAVPVVLGLLVRRSNKWAALIVLGIGTVVAVICTEVFHLLPYGPTVFIVLAAVLLTFWFCRLAYRPAADARYDGSVDGLFERLERPIEPSEQAAMAVSGAAVAASFRLVGLCTVLVAAIMILVVAHPAPLIDRAVIGGTGLLSLLIGLGMMWGARRVLKRQGAGPSP